MPTGRLTTRAAALATAALAVGALAPVPAVHDAVTGAPVPGATLVLPAPYVALAPLCALADAIAGLPVHAHYMLVLSLLATGALWMSGRDGAPNGVRRLGLRALAAVAAPLAVYVAAVLLPRPVPRLVLRDPDAVAVDFHSHTDASHDGRRDYTAAANRAWHAAAGFDVAYVTDHATFASAAAAAAANPRRAGDGTVLLTGVEVRRRGQHLDVLGTGPADSLAYADGELHADALAPDRSTERVLLLTLPAHLDRVRPTDGLHAIELSDGSPRGLEQSDRERRAVVALADSLHLALLAGSDDHGWARNAVAWSVLRIPGWRALSPDALDRAIRAAIRARGRAAVQVIERRASVVPGGSLASPMDELFVRLWLLCRALSWPERAAWLAWIWIPALLSGLTRRTGSSAFLN
ncbi:PHP domain protein [Gemmatirosa kalamazoonensis]|uniref:PHP domain protein n=1 Tax=Gemmatirosa kalamazoonensis TaxID=861299 RepID=W0RK25_9BACT|nr:hypothetical protein [Gemmatirosa kalamazoonensis]AHG89758.1 PHP domain protein [Gemmatirosa kalamazoonensis]